MNTQKTDKKRVVAYARVSTNKNDQANSLENQTTYFKRELERDNRYQLVKINIENICDSGIYYDKGTSGTKLSRPAFDRLLEDAGLLPIIDADNDKKTTTYKIAKKPKFDIIFVKDTSRFARNVNINSILQTLRENKVYVHFLDMGMSTEKEEDLSMIQVFNTFSERESRDKSKKVSFGYQEGVRQGKLYFGGKLIGYDYDKENNCLIVNEKEAELVRLVYDLYTEEELGQQSICNELEKRGYRNTVGNSFKRSTIKRMLQNEKYIGENNCGRYHKEDLFSSKKFVREYDHELRQQARQAQEKQLEQGIVKIPPIITEEQFRKAQEITAKRSEIYKVDGSWHGTTDYACKVVCGKCGAFYTASGRRYYATEGKTLRRYTCRHAYVFDEQSGIPKCNNPAIRESTLDNALNSKSFYEKRLESIEELLVMSDYYIEILNNSVDSDNAREVKRIEDEITKAITAREKIIKLYAEGTYSKEELDRLNNEYTNQIGELTEKKQILSSGNSEIYKRINQLNSLKKEAQKEYKKAKKIVETKQYPKTDRKALLREVDRIVIDIDGNPNIVFKSVSVIDEYIRSMDSTISTYIEASADKTAVKKTLSEVISEFENDEK